MPIPPFDSTGFLPPGCHRTGKPEVKAALVDAFPTLEQRPRLHDAWTDIWDTLHEVLPVPRSWLGGSFRLGQG